MILFRIEPLSKPYFPRTLVKQKSKIYSNKKVYKRKTEKEQWKKEYYEE